ncbi:hypothetical protein PoB_001983000 [Plakobranchus ocellatus]|uniref:Uncharacterized protein n=1 Tax=Plakobranchus ocellatus TaxID=259542 RepID=A0AAV3ZFG4_9GAST|nr:hypothetical protein PoB_001983000 [Plakobranchus ocellatus]
MGFVLHSEICCGHAHSHARLGHGHSHGHSHGQNYGSTSAAADPGSNFAEDIGQLDTLSPSSDVAYELMEGTIDSYQLVNVVADGKFGSLGYGMASSFPNITSFVQAITASQAELVSCALS